ncbi:hypothetical protein F7725_024810, partial [Dissostichus mawsoni]
MDFATSGRSGRRNALPDILGSPAGVNPGDLPLKLAEMTLKGNMFLEGPSPRRRRGLQRRPRARRGMRDRRDRREDDLQRLPERRDELQREGLWRVGLFEKQLSSTRETELPEDQHSRRHLAMTQCYICQEMNLNFGRAFPAAYVRRLNSRGSDTTAKMCLESPKKKKEMAAQSPSASQHGEP